MGCFCFLFNDTATTETYTYRDTLSLHDALPSSPPVRPARPRQEVETAGKKGEGEIAQDFRLGAESQPDIVKTHDAALHCGHAGALSQGAETARRSEEHTSELQSLMRSSYAVFCLKKKKQKKKLTHALVGA